MTKIVDIPITCCDEAVVNEFGREFHWLMDAIFGYNQIRVAKSSQPKLAFAGPNFSKYTYTVIPFGPINSPVIFIIFIHYLDSTWKELAFRHGISIDDNINKKIIVDDIFSWAPMSETGLNYII